LIQKARQLLSAGRLVAFPTETVYGLGADATNAAAIARIFAAKGRPPNNPLIVHVADVSVAKRYATAWPEKAERLAKAFWPGPLTIVVPKTAAIVDAVTAGKQTVGLRVPNHPLALELLRAFDGPVAAPSANRSNHVSPTTAQHVRDELGSSVDLILDGGPCSVGIESTVLDLSSDTPRILRPGGVLREDIEAIIGPVLDKAVIAGTSDPLESPGQLPLHYAPHTPCYRLDELGQLRDFSPSIGVLAMGSDLAFAHPCSIIILPDDPAHYARQLYAAMRELDGKKLQAIYVQMPPHEPEWVAVRDRLMRATKPAG
jgi:L-threonylcarbamoyladenylate synthase